MLCKYLHISFPNFIDEIHGNKIENCRTFHFRSFFRNKNSLLKRSSNVIILP